MHQHHPSLPALMLYQDVEQHVEVVGDPEALEADASEVVGGEHVHHGQDHEQQHSRHACERRGWGVLGGIRAAPLGLYLGWAEGCLS